MLPDTPEFAERADPATLPEWMDGPSSYEQFRDCLHDLAQVNRITRGYAPTLQFLKQVVARGDASRVLHVIDVGCGGGDTLREIARWAERRKLPLRLTGIDLNPHAARAAQELSRDDTGALRASTAVAAIEWTTADVFTYEPSGGVDIVLSSLMTHHLSDAEIVRFVAWMEQTARVGWFINDLYRSRDSYHLFSMLAALMRWHPFVRHDGPASIRRGFREADWQRLLAAAGCAPGSVRVEKHFPARLCVSRIR